MTGYWVKALDAVPVIPPDEANDPAWYPLDHHFALSAFGANLYDAPRAGIELVGEHDESASGQEELYLVVSGAARFTLDGASFDLPAVGVVAVTQPAVRRSAVATKEGTRLLAVGRAASGSFSSSWNPEHFQGVPRAAG